MSKIRGKNTAPEKKLFLYMRWAGIRFRRHYDLPGKPDAAMPTSKIAVFVDGEFWHGRHFDDWEKQLSEFWRNKIRNNIRRDRRNDRLLRKSGWHVLHVWGRFVVKNPDRVIRRILRYGTAGKPTG
jgi:DNA mismatch endonuclease (patch repair protein)